MLVMQVYMAALVLVLEQLILVVEVVVDSIRKVAEVVVLLLCQDQWGLFKAPSPSPSTLEQVNPLLAELFLMSLH